MLDEKLELSIEELECSKTKINSLETSLAASIKD